MATMGTAPGPPRNSPQPNANQVPRFSELGPMHFCHRRRAFSIMYMYTICVCIYIYINFDSFFSCLFTSAYSNNQVNNQPSKQSQQTEHTNMRTSKQANKQAHKRTDKNNESSCCDLICWAYAIGVMQHCNTTRLPPHTRQLPAPAVGGMGSVERARWASLSGWKIVSQCQLAFRDAGSCKLSQVLMQAHVKLVLLRSKQSTKSVPLRPLPCLMPEQTRPLHLIKQTAIALIGECKSHKRAGTGGVCAAVVWAQLFLTVQTSTGLCQRKRGIAIQASGQGRARFWCDSFLSCFLVCFVWFHDKQFTM